MAVSMTVIPNRHRVEPLNVRAYDAWQDSEGCVDASDACRVAWAAFRDTWQAARRVDLEPVPEVERADWTEGLDAWDASGLRRAREIGGMFGLCPRVRTRLSPASRGAWWRWRARVLRHDPRLWGALWCLISGEGVAVVAARIGRQPLQVERAARMVLGWLARELYEQVRLPALLIVKGCEPGPLAPTPPKRRIPPHDDLPPPSLPGR